MARSLRHVSDFDKVMHGYKTLAQFIAGECCNSQKFTHHPQPPPVEVRGPKHYAAAVRACKARHTIKCIATGHECDIIKRHEDIAVWRSPMSAAPGEDPLKETSGDGICSWFEAALLPLLPDQLVSQYEERDHGGSTGKRRSTAGKRRSAPARRAGRLRARSRTR